MALILNAGGKQIIKDAQLFSSRNHTESFNLNFLVQEKMGEENGTHEFWGQGGPSNPS